MGVWALVFILAVVFNQSGARPANSATDISEMQSDNPNVKRISAYPTPKLNPNQLPKGNKNEDKYFKKEKEEFEEKDATNNEKEVQNVKNQETLKAEEEDVFLKKEAPQNLSTPESQKTNTEGVEEEGVLDKTESQPEKIPMDTDMIIIGAIQEEGVPLPEEELTPEVETPSVPATVDDGKPIIEDENSSSSVNVHAPSEEYYGEIIDEDQIVDGEFYVLEDPEIIPGVTLLTVETPIEVVEVEESPSDPQTENMFDETIDSMGKTVTPLVEPEPVTVTAELPEFSSKPMVSFPWSEEAIEPIEPNTDYEEHSDIMAEEGEKSALSLVTQEEVSPIAEPGGMVVIPDIEEMTPAVELEPVLMTGEEVQPEEVITNQKTKEEETELSSTQNEKISLKITKEELNIKEKQNETELMANETKTTGDPESDLKGESTTSPTFSSPVIKMVEGMEDVTEKAMEMGEELKEEVTEIPEESPSDQSTDEPTTTATAIEDIMDESENITLEPELTVNPNELTLQEEQLLEDDPSINETLV